MSDSYLHAERAALDFDGWMTSLPDGARSGLQHQLSLAPDKAAEKRRIANTLWLASRTGLDLGTVDERYETIRDGFTYQQGMPTVPYATDEQFFGMVKQQAAGARDERTLVEDLATQARRAALWHPTMPPDTYPSTRTWREAKQSAPGFQIGKVGNYEAAWSDIHAQERDRFAPVKEAMDAAWSAIYGPQKGDEPLPGDIWAAAKQISELPENQVSLVMAGLRERAEMLPEEEREGFFSRLGQQWTRALNQTASATVRDFPLQVGAKLLEEGGLIGESLGVEGALQEGLDMGSDLRRPTRIARRLTDLRGEKLDPIDGENLLDRVGLGVMGSIPQMLVAASVSPWAMLPQFTVDAQAELSRTFESQGMEAGDADRIAGEIAPAAGAAMAAIEQLTFGFSRGPTAALQRSIASKLAQSAAATRFSAGLAVETAEQFAQEVLQDSTPTILAEIANKIGAPVPDQELAQRVAQAASPETLGVSIVFALGGGGRMPQVEQTRALQSLGFTPDAIDAVIAAPSEAARQAAFQEGLMTATPPADPAADIRTETATQQAAAAAGAIPSIRATREGFVITHEGKEVGREESADAAVATAKRYSDHLDNLAAEETAWLASQLELSGELAKRGGTDLTMETEVRPGQVRTAAQERLEAAEAEDAGAEERLLEQSRLRARADGADAAAVEIVQGSNRVEFVDRVARSASQIFEGATPTTVIHENAHGSFKAGLQAGVFTEAGTLRIIRHVEQVTGQTFIAEADDAKVGFTALDEAVSELAEAEVIGQRKNGRTMTPGSVNRALRSFGDLVATNDAARAKEAKGFKHFLGALRGLMRQVFRRAMALRKAKREGKLGADYDAFMEKLLRVDTQAGHNRRVLDAAGVTVQDLATSSVRADRNVDLAAFRDRARAEVGPSGVSYSIKSGITPAQDAEYMKAVEAGDMEAAQRMVDAAAKAAGYNVGPVYRGTPVRDWRTGEEINVYRSTNGPWSSFWTGSRPVAEKFASAVSNWTRPRTEARVVNAYLKFKSRGVIDAKNKPSREFQIDSLDISQRNTEVLAYIISDGYDGVEIKNTSDEGTIYITRYPWQSKSSDPVTRDESGNVIPLSQRFNTADDRISFSLTSADILDRIAPRLAAAGKPPKARRQMYADAQAEVEGMARAMRHNDSLGKPTPKKEMLRSLAALDAILMQFPAEVRGKVGGFTRLASLETNKAREAFLRDRVEKLGDVLERHLRRQYSEDIAKLFLRAKPAKAEPGQKPTGKLTADAQEVINAAQAAMADDATKIIGRVASLDAQIASGNLSPEAEQLAETERELVQLTGDWKNADAARMAAAVEAVETVLDDGLMQRAQQRADIRARRDQARGELMLATGKLGTPAEQQAVHNRETGQDKQLGALANFYGAGRGTAKKFWLGLSSYEEVLRYAFGDTPAAQQLIDAERAAAYQYEDAVQAITEKVADFFTKRAGSALEGERMRYRLSQPTITTGNSWGTLSEMQAIQALLMWRQEDGRRHMEAFNIDGQWITRVEGQMTDDGRAVMALLENLYAAEYAPLNALYRQRHGMNLPHHANYAPITVTPQQAAAGQMIDPVSGQPTSGSILTPGSLRTRSKVATAKPRLDDALAVFVAHTRQMEFWKAYYDTAVDTQQILLNRNLMDSVQAKSGEEAVNVLRQWVTLIGQGGHRDAASLLGSQKGLQAMMGRAARMALVGRVGTLIIQSTQLAAASVEMPAGAYISRFGKLMSGQMNWGDALNSEFVQRRVQQMPPVVQQAMAGLDSKDPNVVKHATQRLGQLISGADGLFTAGTYAILLDYHRGQAKGMGLTGAEADAYAKEQAERSTERVAQPTRMGTRSLFENMMTHPIAKLGWAFASEGRQKLSIFAWSLQSSDPKRLARATFLTWVVGGLMASVIRNAWRDARDDDDDEVFDEKNWNLKRLAINSITGPFQGIPGLGNAIETAINRKFGVWAPDGDLFDSLSKAVTATGRLATLDFLDDNAPVETVLRDVESLIMGAGLFNETAASAASIAHLVRDGVAIVDNLDDTEAEAEAKKAAADRKTIEEWNASRPKREVSEEEKAMTKEQRRARDAMKAAAIRAQAGE